MPKYVESSRRWEPVGDDYTNEEAEAADTLNFIDFGIDEKHKCTGPSCGVTIPSFSVMCWKCWKDHVTKQREMLQDA